MSMDFNWLESRGSEMGGEMGAMMAAPVFAGQKLVVVGGSSGMGRQTAADVVAAGGSAVIIGQHPDKVADTVKELSQSGSMAYGITADLSDRMAAEATCAQLASDHADATLLLNAAGLFLPKPFLDHDSADYDAYQELNRAIFFLTRLSQGFGWGAIRAIGTCGGADRRGPARTGRAGHQQSPE